MAGFNYSEYFYATLNGGYRFARSDANRDEYRQGVMDTAKDIISVFDTDNANACGRKRPDGKLNFQEYIAKERADMLLAGYNQEDIDKLEDKHFEKDFSAIDVDNDGTIDYKEMANFLHLADAQDTKNSDGTCESDGVITRVGIHTLDTKDYMGTMLKKNYKENNFSVLGNKGDIDPSKIRQMFSDECKNGYSSTLRFPEGARVFVLDPNTGKLVQLKNGDIVPRSMIYGNGYNSQNSAINEINQQNMIQKLIEMLIKLFNVNTTTSQSQSTGYIGNGYLV